MTKKLLIFSICVMGLFEEVRPVNLARYNLIVALGEIKEDPKFWEALRGSWEYLHLMNSNKLIYVNRDWLETRMNDSLKDHFCENTELFNLVHVITALSESLTRFKGCEERALLAAPYAGRLKPLVDVLRKEEK